MAFNVWFERDPSTTTDPFCCPNPGSVARIKCSWWGTYATSTTANNKGQYRDQFQVIMAGSNGQQFSCQSFARTFVDKSITQATIRATPLCPARALYLHRPLPPQPLLCAHRLHRLWWLRLPLVLQLNHHLHQVQVL